MNLPLSIMSNLKVLILITFSAYYKYFRSTVCEARPPDGSQAFSTFLG